MKRNILYAVLLSLLWLPSCAPDEGLNVYGEEKEGFGSPRTRVGFISLQVTDRHVIGDELSDDIRTIRFIVLTDLDTYPRVESADQHRIINSQDGRVAALRANLGVSKSDKLVVVVVNEPNNLLDRLDEIGTMRGLEALQLEMDEIITNDDYRSLAHMPMSGTVWVPADLIKDTEAEIEAADYVPNEVTLDRAVARVDVHLSTELDDGVTINAGSTITLKNTYDKSPLVYHEYKPGVDLGYIQTVPTEELLEKPFTTGQIKIQENTNPDPKPDDGPLICSFYTPERFCLTDKLEVEIELDTDRGPRSATVTIDLMKDEDGIERPVDIVRRNNRYIVSGEILDPVIPPTRSGATTGIEVRKRSERLD